MESISMVLEKTQGPYHGILTKGNPPKCAAFSLHARMGYFKENSKQIFFFLGSNDR